MKILFLISTAIILFLISVPTGRVADASNNLRYPEANGYCSGSSILLFLDQQPLEPRDMYIIFSDLFIYPAEVTTGHEVTISVIAANTSSVNESYTVNLRINDEIASTREINLGPYESKTISFNTKQNVSGEYTVKIGNVNGSFTVKDPVAFRSISLYWEILIILTLVCVIFIWISIGFYARKKHEN